MYQIYCSDSKIFFIILMSIVSSRISTFEARVANASACLFCTHDICSNRILKKIRSASGQPFNKIQERSLRAQVPHWLDNEPRISSHTKPMNSHLQGRYQPYYQSLTSSFFVRTRELELEWEKKGSAIISIKQYSHLDSSMSGRAFKGNAPNSPV